jgi:hypothetical protein
MKITSLVALLILTTFNLYAEKNWIPLAVENQTHTPKPSAKVDINLSQIAPINAMMQKAALFKQLLDATTQKEKVATNDKNWFVLEKEDSK